MQPTMSDAASGARTQLRRYAVLLVATALILAGALGFAAFSGWQTEKHKQLQVASFGARAVAGTIDLELSRAERSFAEIAERLASDLESLKSPSGMLPRELQRLRSALPALDGLGVVNERGAVIDSAADNPRFDPTLVDAAPWLQGDGKFSVGGLVITIADAPFADGIARLAIWHSILGTDGRLLGAVYGLLPSARVIAMLRRGVPNPRFTIDLLLADRLIFLAPSATHGAGAPLPAGRLRELLMAGNMTGIAAIAASPDRAPGLGAFEVSPRFGLIAVSSTTIAEIWTGWIAEHRVQMLAFALFFVAGLILKACFFVALRRGLLAESKLRETGDAAFQDIIRNLTDGFILWDRDHRLVLWNERVVELWPEVRGRLRVGMSFEESSRIVVEGYKTQLPPAAFDALLRDILQDHTAPGAGRYDRRLPDGRVIEIVRAPTADGRVVSLYRDVTEQRSLVDRLARSEGRFRDGIDSMEEGLALWDRDDRLVLWNRRYCEILPHMRALVRQGIHIRDLNLAAFGVVRSELAPEDVASVVDARLAHRKASKLRALNLPDGRIVEVKDLPTSEGGMVSIHRDVTERNRRQAELHRALATEREMNAQQRRFITVTSHEFRTPLTIIDGAAQRLLSEFPADAPTKLALRVDRIRGAVSRMIGILERTLFAARMDDEPAALKTVTIDLGTLLESVCARQRLVSPLFAIELSLPAEPLSIEGDQNMLDFVFTNLVGNAVTFAGAVREVEVSASVATGTVEIVVRDRGIGIPADEIDRLFMRFFRASNAAGITGTGIGLHLVKSFVDKHAGAVAVASEIGRGSAFTVRLPCRQAQTTKTDDQAA